ncbi:MAG TPA: NUMOD4 motif-containing HNH endonuclease [Candidatus Desulfovibrio gallistercoris]|nr:NUMOD4 motif-containing HNH endonuclease [Candidatus Desulfovibrio gallistercoris]
MNGESNGVFGEIWKDISGYEGLYMVSNMGRVRALAKQLKTSLSNNCRRFLPMREISPIVQHSGYAHIGLWRGGQCKQARLHRLVAEAFCPNDDPENKTQVNHKNENKLDNRAENLEWVTPKQNTNHGSAIARRIYGRQKAVDCLDLNGKWLRTFISQADANAWCEVARNDGHIAACCSGKQKTAYGFRWRYAEKRR